MSSQKDRDISEVEFQLRKLFHTQLENYDVYHWPNEDMRYTELVFSLLSFQNPPFTNVLREIVSRLYDLGLLDVQSLSTMEFSNDSIDMNNKTSQRISQILTEYGFTFEQTKSCIITLYQLANSLKNNYDGKVQKYFRKYGQLMLDGLEKDFSITNMDKDIIRQALTFWLQNVLNMPISLMNQDLETFCNKIGVTSEELIAEADKLNINVAILDDLIASSPIIRSEVQR
jgi:hypothetical protein